MTTGGAGSPGSEKGDVTLSDGAHVVWTRDNTLTLSAYHSIIFMPGSLSVIALTRMALKRMAIWSCAPTIAELDRGQ